MLKKILIILNIILFTGCFNKKTDNYINTVIEEDKNILIGMNYPITNINKLDKIIKKDVEKIYNDFKNEYENFNSINDKAELNIDYTYNTIFDNYINISINIFIDSSKLANPINYVNTYVFDIKKNKLITLEDIVNKDNLTTLTKYINTELFKKYSNCLILDEVKKTIIPDYNSYKLFTFDNDNLTIYFNPANVSNSYCGILKIDVPLNKLNLNIKTKKETEMTLKNVEIPDKVIDPNKKVVALTFDDGPSKYTEELIKVLKENDVCATFFVLGNKVEIYNKTIRNSLKYGNEIGNHSYNHKWLTKLDNESIKEQINKTQEIIKNTTGYEPIIMRPTYGSINNKLRNNVDLDIILWTVDTMDWKYKSVDKIVSRGTKNVKDLDIILMHDTHKRTVEAVKKMIPILKNQGFQFVTISELNEVKLLRANSN